MISVISFIIFVSYGFYFTWFFVRYTTRSSQSKPEPDLASLTEFPKISVIVCARNEQSHIAKSIDSLLALDYPEDKIQILLVSDHSTDSTLDIINEYADKHKRITALADPPYIEGIEGKQRAIDFALEYVTGEYVLFTDADCTVPATWAKRVILSYNDPKVGAVFGPIDVDDEAAPLYAKLNSMELVVHQNFCSAHIRRGEYLGMMGGNMSVRKQVVDEIGGFSTKSKFVNEDIKYGGRIVKEGKWKIAHFESRDGWVTTAPPDSIKDMIHQRMRWLKRVPDSPMKKVTNLYCLHGSFFISLFILGFFDPVAWFYFIAFVFLKLAVDIWVSHYSIAPYKAKRWWYIPLVTLLQLFFLLVLVYLWVFDPPVSWKGRQVS